MRTFTDYVNSEFPNWQKFSQSNEDAVIEAIFQRIGLENKTCMEFGAADGEFCSNTAYLWQSLGWSAVLVESDPALFRKLQSRTARFPVVEAHEGFVENPSIS